MKTRNSLRQRCDSCGEPYSHKKYNLAYLCYGCLAMDSRGVVRSYTPKEDRPREFTPKHKKHSWRKKRLKK